MRRLAFLACLIALAACGGGPSAGQQGPPSAQQVAQSSTDFPGLMTCPDSGSYDKYLQAEKTTSPDKYATDKKTWDDLKAAGANDTYIAANADKSSDCNQFGSTNLSGKVAFVFAIRFKDAASAGASYKNEKSQFNLSDSQLASLKAFGGKVDQGATTGLGANSLVVTFDAAGVTFYIALWQDKEFEVALVVYNLPTTDGGAAATKINGRIR
ncbi:MAG TPA: hypothetical protein VGT01_03315 [Candidatus Dormibacteraeota bacterium]|nr:hypothetical protein [Candidatus Dormibacteraeota bacterium]